jgi:hypothetical protein
MAMTAGRAMLWRFIGLLLVEAEAALVGLGSFVCVLPSATKVSANVGVPQLEENSLRK